MDLTLIECLDCHVIFPGNESHSCRNDKISCGNVKQGLPNRYIEENGASTSNVQYVSGVQTVDCNILTDNSVQHAESRCHTEDSCSDNYFVNMIPNSLDINFLEWEHCNLQDNTTQKHFLNSNSLSENSAYIYHLEQHSFALQSRALSNSYFGSPVSAILNISNLIEEIVSTVERGMWNGNAESDDKKPQACDPEFASLLQTLNEQPSPISNDRIPLEEFLTERETTDVNQSMHFKKDNRLRESLENASIESLIPSIGISEVKDILKNLGFADGQNGVWPLNQSSTEANSRAYDYASKESPNEDKLQPIMSDENTDSSISGSNFETQYRIENGRYICLLCDKSYSAKSCLVFHFRTHIREKPYVCDESGKRFARKYTLDIHLLIHTGEKPYACNECEKRFAQKKTLNFYLLTHTGEKSFVCNWCKKRFSRKDHLASHMRLHKRE